MPAQRENDDDLTTAVEKIASAMEDGYQQQRPVKTTWEKPVNIGQLIVTSLGMLAVVFGSVWMDRIAYERNLTQLQERQNAVLNTHLPQARSDIQVLHQRIHDQDEKLDQLQKEIASMRLDQLRHERDDAARRYNPPSYRGQPIP